MLDISLDRPGLEYRFNVCVKRTLGFCRKTEVQYERFDLTDPAVRQRLVDMGFVAMVEPKP